MVSEVLEQKNVTFPIQQYNFGLLLKGRTWIAVGSQIIFNKNGASYITNINNNLYKYTVEHYRQLPEGPLTN